MGYTKTNMDIDDLFYYKNVEELAQTCTQFYHNLKRKESFFKKRIRLLKWIEKFHKDCETLTPEVEEAINKLKDRNCVFLMTAHQPNLFAYSGVLRKATLNHVLSKKLSEKMNLPVVNFFGIADQDFTNDRWVKTSLLPDVERRNGFFELRIKLPEKIMLNRVSKPSKEILEKWRSEIKNWFHWKLYSIKKFCQEFKIESNLKEVNLLDNFNLFWEIVTKAYEKAENYSDFNAFVISKIINKVWGYSTLFCRFSECQQIFDKEFGYLLTHFTEYSYYVKKAIRLGNDLKKGIYKREHQTIPFWYHCDCGGKVRLLAEKQGDSIIGHGECLNCKKEYKVHLLSKGRPKISGILSRISARSLSTPLIFFSGLGVCCYVGGVGGISYLKQAKYVAENLRISFPPVVIWRPHDIYLGVGQLDALLTFRKLSGTLNFSEYPVTITKLRERVTNIKNEIEELELQKKTLMNYIGVRREEIIERIKKISNKQNEIKRQTNFSVLVRNLKLLENVTVTLNLIPSIIDYALNVELRETSEQWIRYLERNGDLRSDIYLKSILEDLIELKPFTLALSHITKIHLSAENTNH